MVKPVFKALNEMSSAQTGEDAFEIGKAFLLSADAKHVDDSRAGTFVNRLGEIFGKHQAPDLHKALLEVAVGRGGEVSFGLHTSSTFALTDLRMDTAYNAAARDILVSNAKILMRATASQTQGKDGVFTQHEGGPEIAHPEISAARTPHDLENAVNDTLLVGTDITDANADEFMRVLDVALRKTKANTAQKINILTIVADFAGDDDLLRKLADERICSVVDASQGPSPLSSGTQTRTEKTSPTPSGPDYFLK